MRAALGSFKFKLVVYFVLLSLLPMAATYWGFTTVAGQSESRRVDARVQAGLRVRARRLPGARSTCAGAGRSGSRATARSRSRSQKRDSPDLRRCSREYPGSTSSAPAASASARPADPRRAAPGRRRHARRHRRRGRRRTSRSTRRSSTSLRARAGLAPADVLACVAGIAHRGRVAGRGTASSTRAGRTRRSASPAAAYRTLVAQALGTGSGARVRRADPQSLIDAANATSARPAPRRPARVALHSSRVVAYLEGRSIVRTLRGLAEAARGIARGRLAERVPGARA